MAKCSSCGAEVLFVTMAKSGKSMPVNPDSREKRVAIGPKGKALVLDTFVAHWATCTNPNQHRRST